MVTFRQLSPETQQTLRQLRRRWRSLPWWRKPPAYDIPVAIATGSEVSELVTSGLTFREMRRFITRPVSPLLRLREQLRNEFMEAVEWLKDQ